MDGKVYVYDHDIILASFTYTGGLHIGYLRFNTKGYIDKNIRSFLKLDDSYMACGNELKELLDKLLPNASDCHHSVKYAYEFSIIESALCDPSTKIEVSDPDRFGFLVKFENPAGFISGSFRCNRSGKLKHVWVRYNSRTPDIRLKEMVVPLSKRKWLHEVLGCDTL